MAIPAGNFSQMPGEAVTPSSAPYARSGKAQPRSGSSKKTKKVTVKKHTRTVQPKAPAGPKPPTAQDILNAAVRLRYGGQEQAINQQLQGNARFTSGLGDWYSNALNEIKGLQAQGNAQAQQTLGAIQNYNSSPTLNNPTDQQAALARNSLNSQYGAMVGRDANANSAAMDRLAAAYVAQQGNTRNQANAERQNILGSLANLQGQKGDFKIQYGADQAAAQAKADAEAIKTNLAAQALGLKVDTLNKVQIPLAKSLAGDRKQGQKIKRTNARTQRQSVAETKRQHDIKNALDTNKLALDAYTKAHPETKVKPITPAVKNKASENYQRATAMVRQVYGDKKHFRPSDVADQLATSKHAVPRDLALAAAELVKNERAGIRGIDNPKLARQIYKRYGIKVPVVKQSPKVGHVVQGLIEKITG